MTSATTQGEGKNEVWACSVFQNSDILPVKRKGEDFFSNRKGCVIALYYRVQLPGSVLAGIWIVQCFGEALAWLLAHPAVLLLCWCAWMASRAVSVVVLLAWNWKQPLLTMTVVFFCHFWRGSFACYWFHDCSSTEGTRFFATGLAGIHGPRW